MTNGDSDAADESVASEPTNASCARCAKYRAYHIVSSSGDSMYADAQVRITSCAVTELECASSDESDERR